MISKICDRISEEYSLRQLAEECCELAQAALKLIRTRNAETPQTEAEAMKAFVEELADAELTMDIARKKILDSVDCEMVLNTYNAKAERFLHRLEGAEE